MEIAFITIRICGFFALRASIISFRLPLLPPINACVGTGRVSIPSGAFAFITWNEKNGRVIEVAQCNRGGYTSFLRDDAIPVPDGADVWFRTKVRKQTYTYEYSFDGENYKEIPVTLDASILSDDYVLQSYGGFFTGAFVGMACVDYAGYNTVAEFRSFDYKEYED